MTDGNGNSTVLDGWKEVRFGYAIDSFIIIDGWCRGEFGKIERHIFFGRSFLVFSVLLID